MITKLSKHGHALALVIDQSILKLMNIDENTELEVVTDGKNLIVARVGDDERSEKFKAALADGNKRFETTFRKLAE